MIRLDFFKLLPEMGNSSGFNLDIIEDVIPDSDCHFTPYKVFILETRLYPLIHNLFFDKHLEIYLKSEYNSEKNRMDVYLMIKELENTIDPSVENKLIQLSKQERNIIENKIHEIQSTYVDYALIDINELYDSINIVDRKSKDVNNLANKIPFAWFQSVLPYIAKNLITLPLIALPEGIYVKFNSDYKNRYYELSRFLVEKVKDFYKRGVVVLNGVKGEDYIKQKELIYNWDLVNVEERLYEPNWTDDRFARNKVDFLYRKIEGDPYIRFLVSDNLVKRHGIATSLQKENIPLIFEGSYCKTIANSIEEAYKIGALINSSQTINGKVLVIATSRLSYIYLYFDYAKKKYGKDTSVNYTVNSIENPYIFSCLLPEREDGQKSFDELRYEFRNFALDRLIEVSKVSKLSNISPHDIIISEYS